MLGDADRRDDGRPVERAGRSVHAQRPGRTYVAESYRDYNEDLSDCVYLEPAPGAVFAPAAPGVSVYGNGCPSEFNYNVLGVQPGVPDVVGNLRYYSYQGTGTPYVNYAQVVRQKIVPRVANWKTVAGRLRAAPPRARSAAAARRAAPTAPASWAGVDRSDRSRARVDRRRRRTVRRVALSVRGRRGRRERDAPERPGRLPLCRAAEPVPRHGGDPLPPGEPGEATVRIYDVAGRCVRTLATARAGGREHARLGRRRRRGRRLGAGSSGCSCGRRAATRRACVCCGSSEPRLETVRRAEPRRADRVRRRRGEPDDAGAPSLEARGGAPARSMPRSPARARCPTRVPTATPEQRDRESSVRRHAPAPEHRPPGGPRPRGAAGASPPPTDLPCPRSPRTPRAGPPCSGAAPAAEPPRRTPRTRPGAARPRSPAPRSPRPRRDRESLPSTTHTTWTSLRGASAGSGRCFEIDVFPVAQRVAQTAHRVMEARLGRARRTAQNRGHFFVRQRPDRP